ncbi:MAG: 30S ribosomal protein S12 methylthiotransferase RimO [Planctomycetota bacterium]
MNEAIKVCLISLGCARNLVDSEVILGHAVEEGFVVTRDPEDADVAIVNTCGFVEHAKQESIDTILSVCRLKEDGQLKGVIAVGCLTQRYGDELGTEMPEVDAVLGISDYSGVPAIVRQIVNGSRRRWSATIDGGKPKSARSDTNRVLLTPRSFAYLRISEGCDHTCTFCAIPGMRGRNRSKPMDVLVEEAQGLAAAGVKEIVVVAEDSTAYGLDLFRKRKLADLLERIGAVDGVEWIRVMYAYPHTVDRELTRVLREHPKLVPYLDIPIQHISGAMLRAMKRGVSAEQVAEILWRLRDEVPGIAVRSTYIVGFPGETEADFDALLAFTEKYRFERLGVFVWSPEEGTPAFDLPDRVDPDVAEARRARLMALQKDILDAHHRALVGTTRRVLIDGRLDAASVVGRTTADAPEIDCRVVLPAGGLQAGDMVNARITALDDYDLLGELVAEGGGGEA